jgi:hypothetical protein
MFDVRLGIAHLLEDVVHQRTLDQQQRAAPDAPG